MGFWCVGFGDGGCGNTLQVLQNANLSWKKIRNTIEIKSRNPLASPIEKHCRLSICRYFDFDSPSNIRLYPNILHSRYYADFFPVTIVKTADLPPEKR